MDKLKNALRSVLDGKPLPAELVEHIPDMESEEFQRGLLEGLAYTYGHKMPFNKYLGIEIAELTFERAVIQIASREELHGNYVQKILHGGVISAVMDLGGGMIAQVHAVRRMRKTSLGELFVRLSKMSTLNLRVDYLRPGAGASFRCVSRTVRAGNKVAVTQMEMFDEAQDLIAIGAGTYLVG